MNELKHEQARYYLHVGHEYLGGAEQESLKLHLSGCRTCQSYATELDALQTTISRMMHAQWDAATPAAITENGVQRRIRRKILQKRVLNLTSSLASGAVVLGLIVVIAWFFQSPRLLPVTLGSVSVPTRVNQTFGNNITLLGFELSQDHLAAGDTLTVALYWQARVATPTSYAVFIHLQHGDEDGSLVAQRDGIPVNGTRPTTSWKPDEVIEDRQELVLPSTLAPGQYKLVLGLYDPSSGVRLNTSEGKNALTLATVDVSLRSAPVSPSPSATVTHQRVVTDILAHGDPVQFQVCGESKTWVRPTDAEENQKWWTFARYSGMDENLRQSFWTRDFFVAYGNASPEFDIVNLSGLWTLPDGVRDRCFDPLRQDAILKLQTAEVWILLHSVKSIHRNGVTTVLVVEPTSSGVQFVQFPRFGPSPMVLYFVTPEGRQIAQIDEFKSPEWPDPSLLPTPTP
jgi:hypothetical protein